jgi:alpha-1,6-mannosyltransferase
VTAASAATAESLPARRQEVQARRGRAIPHPAIIGSVALATLVAALFALAAGAASGPSSYVPLRTRRFPNWVAGPLHSLGFATSTGVLELLVIVMCIAYVVTLVCASALRSRALWAAIALAHLGALLAPPLLSGDVFGYLGFARLGVLHGLSPYSDTANAAPHDAIVPYLGWHGAHAVTTPYGPLFTLLSYALVPLGIAGGLWALKALAALTSLVTVLLVWRIAVALRRAPGPAIAMYGLNPLVIVFAVGGAHNDTLFGMLVAAGALLLVTQRERLAGGSLILATAVKASASLVLPFALLGSTQRRRLATAMLVVLALVAAVALAVFGGHVLDMASALATEQHQVAVHSVPSELSRLLGLGRLATGVRLAFVVAFAAALLGTLWRTWRGSWWLDCYAWATLALLVCTGWLLPWYGLWALLPASVSGSRRLQVLTLAACAYLVAIKIL